MQKKQNQIIHFSIRINLQRKSTFAKLLPSGHLLSSFEFIIQDSAFHQSSRQFNRLVTTCVSWTFLWFLHFQHSLTPTIKDPPSATISLAKRGFLQDWFPGLFPGSKPTPHDGNYNTPRGTPIYSPIPDVPQRNQDGKPSPGGPASPGNKDLYEEAAFPPADESDEFEYIDGK